MSIEATSVEFRHRFWFIGAIFFLAFSCTFVDHSNAAQSLARAILGHGISADSPQVQHYTRALFALAAAVVALGALIRSWAEAYLHSSVVHDAELHSERLVADGPYRYLRNPLYLGNILLAIGMGSLASRTGFFVLTIAMTIFVYRLIRREEAGLLASQGQSYRKYFDAVPRLIPSLLPRVPAGRGKPNWMDGFTGETFMWACAIAIAAVAKTLNVIYFWITLATGFAIYFFQAYLRDRQEKKKLAGT